MSVQKVLKLTSSSAINWQDAMEQLIAKAGRTVQNINSAHVVSQYVDVADGRITRYRLTAEVTFTLVE